MCIRDRINILSGVTASTAEINYLDGVTSNIQTQLNGKIHESQVYTKGDIDDFLLKFITTYINLNEYNY